MQAYLHKLARRGIIASCFVPVLLGLLRTLAPPTSPVIIHDRFQPAVVLEGMPELRWTADLDAALWEAGRDRKVVLAVFNARTDTNARLNEKHVLAREEVRRALKRFVLVMLYIDIVPAVYYRWNLTDEDQRKDAEANRDLMRMQLNDAGDPMYVLLRPVEPGKFEPIANYNQGKITDVDRFLRFLGQPTGPSEPGRQLRLLIESFRDGWCK